MTYTPPKEVDADRNRFIEEHHAQRYVDKQAQSNRPPAKNGPTQDMMAFWGKLRWNRAQISADCWRL